MQESGGDVIEQIIRPTGLLDPIIEIRPATNQVDDCLEEIRKATQEGSRVLVTTLTKKLAEDLAKYLTEIGVKAKYLHSDIDTLERVQIIKELRIGVFDVLVGINLLREGIDIPEVSLVAILDADKEGFLRSQTALIQTCGRAARNVKGRVVMYADKITKSIQATVEVTNNRRKIQEEYNSVHGIIPYTVSKLKAEDLVETFGGKRAGVKNTAEEKTDHYTQKELEMQIKSLEQEMRKSAKELRFEEAALLRDQLRHYQGMRLLEENL